jgi:hypothetical protein
MLLCSTVKPLRVSLVEPVAYLGDSYAGPSFFVSLCQEITFAVPLLDQEGDRRWLMLPLPTTPTPPHLVWRWIRNASFGIMPSLIRVPSWL